jgi:uncharacterized protein YjbJ (UPF0337 family)
MNWDRIEGQWKQRRGKAMGHWGKIMNDELAAVAGKYEELVGKLQEGYGIAKEEAKEKVGEFKKEVEQSQRSKGKLRTVRKSPIKKKLRKTLLAKTNGQNKKYHK